MEAVYFLDDSFTTRQREVASTKTQCDKRKKEYTTTRSSHVAKALARSKSLGIARYSTDVEFFFITLLPTHSIGTHKKVALLSRQIFVIRWLEISDARRVVSETYYFIHFMKMRTA